MFCCVDSDFCHIPLKNVDGFIFVCLFVLQAIHQIRFIVNSISFSTVGGYLQLNLTSAL